jgi:hypothetical protein
MGFMNRFSRKQPHAATVAMAQEEAPKFAHVNWRQEPGLRKLYFYAIILSIASATTGYDGYGNTDHSTPK